MKPRDVLVAFSYKYNGDWKKMYASLKNKDPLSEDDINEAYKNISAPFLSLTDKEFPAYFKSLYCPPMLFYYYGDISLLQSKFRITCIGSRKPTLYQNDKVYEIVSQAEDMLQNQLVVISGMAIGLDSAALRAAMDKNAPIICILGTGIENIYPIENKDIYEYCKSGKGLILSEFPNQGEYKPDNFVFRNRLLAASSPVIFVGGVNEKSGSMSTITRAIELGKDIYVLPCNVTKEDNGCKLIRDGAYVCTCAEDLVNAIKENA